MSAADPTAQCEAMAAMLVDYVEGDLDSDQRASVAAHCADCSRCADSLAALRDVPAMLRRRVEPPVRDWDGEQAKIMAVIDEMAEAEAARRRGFDARILLPLAAALVIAFAGVVSLLSNGGVGGTGAQPARAALRLAMEDPVMAAELSDLLGEPLLFSSRLWIEQDDDLIEEVEPWIDPDLDSPPSAEDLGQEGAAEVGRMLGA